MRQTLRPFHATFCKDSFVSCPGGSGYCYSDFCELSNACPDLFDREVSYLMGFFGRPFDTAQRTAVVSPPVSDDGFTGIQELFWPTSSDGGLLTSSLSGCMVN